MDRIGFKQAVYQAREGESVTISVSRTGTGQGEVSVRVSLQSLGATVGRDIERFSQLLTWPDGDTTDKTFTLTPREDLLDENSEDLAIRLWGLKNAIFDSIFTTRFVISENVSTSSVIADDDLVQFIQDGDPQSGGGASRRGIAFSDFKTALGSMPGDGNSPGGYPVIPTAIWDDNNDTVNFYLDTIDGNDANDGLTETTPVKTWERAIAIIKQKRISWNWNTFLRIKGTLQAPLDLRAIHAESSDIYIQGTLCLTNWTNDSDDPKWTLQGASQGETPLAFIAENDISLWIQNVNFVVVNKLVFHKFDTWIENSIFTSTPGCGRVYFGDGLHGLADSITFDYTGSYFEVIASGLKTSLYLDGTFNFIGATDSQTRLLRACYGAVLLARNCNCMNVPARTIRVSSYGKAIISNHSLCSFDRDTTSEIIYDQDSNAFFPTFHHFSTLANGRYLVACSPRKGRLMEWNLWAKSGTGTFQMDIGLGYPWGDPLTMTFNNYDSRLNRSMNFDCAWHDSNGFFLNVTNSSGLTDVVIEMLWRSY